MLREVVAAIETAAAEVEGTQERPFLRVRVPMASLSVYIRMHANGQCR